MNPAEELLEIFKKWEANDNNTLYLVRGTQNGITYDLAKDLTHATALFQEILDTLEARDDIKDWQEFIVATWKFLYAPQENWSANVPSNAIYIPGIVRTGLLGLGPIMQSAYPGSFAIQDISADEIATLVKTLQEVKEQIGSIPQRYQKLTDSITSKLDTCLFILRSDDITPGGLREAREKSLELVGESLHAVILLPKDERHGFFNRLVSISAMLGGNVVAGASGNLLSDVIGPLLGLPS